MARLPSWTIAQVAAQPRFHAAVVLGQLLLGEETGLDAQRQVDFLLSVEQGDLADLLQVVLDGVGGSAGGHDLLGGGVVVVGIGVDEAGTGFAFLALLCTGFLGGLDIFVRGIRLYVRIFVDFFRGRLGGARILLGGSSPASGRAAWERLLPLPLTGRRCAWQSRTSSERRQQSPRRELQQSSCPVTQRTFRTAVCDVTCGQHHYDPVKSVFNFKPKSRTQGLHGIT